MCAGCSVCVPGICAPAGAELASAVHDRLLELGLLGPVDTKKEEAAAATAAAAAAAAAGRSSMVRL